MDYLLQQWASHFIPYCIFSISISSDQSSLLQRWLGENGIILEHLQSIWPDPTNTDLWQRRKRKNNKSCFVFTSRFLDKMPGQLSGRLLQARAMRCGIKLTREAAGIGKALWLGSVVLVIDIKEIWCATLHCLIVWYCKDGHSTFAAHQGQIFCIIFIRALTSNSVVRLECMSLKNEPEDPLLVCPLIHVYSFFLSPLRLLLKRWIQSLGPKTMMHKIRWFGGILSRSGSCSFCKLVHLVVTLDKCLAYDFRCLLFYLIKELDGQVQSQTHFSFCIQLQALPSSHTTHAFCMTIKSYAPSQSL